MFENAKTSTKQGDIGEARAIYEYTKLGYGVSRTLFDSMKYDIIIDVDGKLLKVQVKTTKFKSKYGIYKVGLRTCGGNQSFKTTRKRENSDYDYLFVLSSDGTCWSIPTDDFDAKNSLNLGTKFDKYKL